jgi:hypothetical protein
MGVGQKPGSQTRSATLRLSSLQPEEQPSRAPVSSAREQCRKLVPQPSGGLTFRQRPLAGKKYSKLNYKSSGQGPHATQGHNVHDSDGLWTTPPRRLTAAGCQYCTPTHCALEVLPLRASVSSAHEWRPKPGVRSAVQFPLHWLLYPWPRRCCLLATLPARRDPRSRRRFWRSRQCDDCEFAIHTRKLHYRVTQTAARDH